MTPTMVVDYAEGILLKKFRENVVHMGKIYRNIPAYQWPGAGSEKGGSSGHLNFSKIIFAESEGLKKGERLAISVGRRNGQRDSGFPIMIENGGDLRIPYNPKMYGVLRVIIPEEVATEAVKREKSKGNSFDHTLYSFLKCEYSNYAGISLFAFDGEFSGLKHGFCIKKRKLIDERLDDLLQNFYVYGYFDGPKNPDRKKGIELSHRLAERLLEPENFSKFDKLENLAETSPGYKVSSVKLLLDGLRK